MFYKYSYIKYIGLVITAIIMILFTTDFVAYLHGGVTATEYITILQPDKDNPVGYFKINNRYWGIGGYFQKKQMILSPNLQNTEIRFIKTDSFLTENKCVIYYLPITKLILKIEIPLTGDDFKPSNFIFYNFNSKISQFGLCQIGIFLYF